MRINIGTGEHIVACLPKIWIIKSGFMGFFSRSKEGILCLTNKQLIFVPRFVFISEKERGKYFDGDEAKVTLIEGYSESQLDEDLSEHHDSLAMPLESIIEVKIATLRKVNFLRIRCMKESKVEVYDFGITKSVTNYPLRQPLLFDNLNWEPWIKLIKAYLRDSHL
jgi:hypothetical protein